MRNPMLDVLFPRRRSHSDGALRKKSKRETIKWTSLKGAKKGRSKTMASFSKDSSNQSITSGKKGPPALNFAGFSPEDLHPPDTGSPYAQHPTLSRQASVSEPALLPAQQSSHSDTRKVSLTVSKFFESNASIPHSCDHDSEHDLMFYLDNPEDTETSRDVSPNRAIPSSDEHPARRYAHMARSADAVASTPLLAHSAYDGSHESVAFCPNAAIHLRGRKGSRSASSKKKASFWFTRVGHASKAFEELGQDIHEYLPALVHHADETLDAIKDAAIAACDLVTGTHSDNHILPEPGCCVPDVLEAVRSTADAITHQLDAQDIKDIANAFRGINLTSTEATNMLHRVRQMVLYDGRALLIHAQKLAFVISPAIFILIIVSIFGFATRYEATDGIMEQIFILAVQLVCFIAFLLATVIMLVALISYAQYFIDHIKTSF